MGKKSPIEIIRLFLFFLFFVGSPISTWAGGLLGDAINIIAPGVGTTFDDAHRQIKEAIPPYKQVEESASHTVNETFVQAGAPLLQELIIRSRDDAIRAGVQPIPVEIQENLAGFVPNWLLNVARYRVQGGGDLTLQVNAIRYGEASAITLDYVIVFKDQNDALYNPTLWAHELTHIDQYQRWGIRDFSIRYLRSYQSVEGEAYEAETKYAAWVGVRNSQRWASIGNPINPSSVNHPVSPFSLNASSSSCSTAFGVCQVNGSAPVGTPCWCSTPMGAATGSLVPTNQINTPPSLSGLPSGYVIQTCGCWGPNPASNAVEPRCLSGRVGVNVCQGFCAPGHPVYAYVCL